MGQDHSQLVEVAAFHHILHRCSWEDRFKLLSLNRSYRAHIHEMETWRLFCEWLENDEFIHVQRGPGEDWKDAFLNHVALRKRWHIPQELLSPDAANDSQAVSQRQQDAPHHPDNIESAEVREADTTPEDAHTHFSINVVARFRPLPQNQKGDADSMSKESSPSSPEASTKDNASVRAIVPLHQRIRMIQAHHKCSPSEARKLLWAGQGDVSEFDPWRSATVKASKQHRAPLKEVSNGESLQSVSEQSVSAVDASKTHAQDGPNCCNKDTREQTKPKSEGQLSDGDAQHNGTGSGSDNMVDCGGGGDDDDRDDDNHHGAHAQQAASTSSQHLAALPASIRTGVLAVRPTTKDLVLCTNGGVRRFEFDGVLSDTMNQEALYELAARKQVGHFLNGVNACVICYGQTGSGKTYSMFGPDDLASSTVTRLSDHAGIAPRAVTEVVNTVFARKEHGLEASLRISIVEIFGQVITDLLHDRSVIGAWHGVAARAVLNNDAAEEIINPFALDELLLRAERSKRRAATAMNDRSSRAHTIILLSLDQKNPRTASRLTSTLCLADLGGSEQLKKSKAEGVQQEEARNINIGLLALKRVISALNANNSDHVPFGDTTLTSLLKPGLSGNSYTSVVVTGSLEACHVQETVQTMRFGEACQAVKGTAVSANVNPETQAIDAINSEIEELEQRIRSEERWVNKTIVREDQDGKETVVTSVLVGAEELRDRYEELLQIRSELLGI